MLKELHDKQPRRVQHKVNSQKTFGSLIVLLCNRLILPVRLQPDRRSGLACLLSGLFGTPGDDGLQGHVILARGFAKVGVEGVIADRQGEVVRAGVLVLLLPDATTFDQFAARGAAKDAVRRCHGVAAGDGFDCDVEVEG